MLRMIRTDAKKRVILVSVKMQITRSVNRAEAPCRDKCDRSETAISVPERAYGAPRYRNETQPDVTTSLTLTSLPIQIRLFEATFPSPVTVLLFAHPLHLWVNGANKHSAASVNKTIAFSY